MSQSAEVFQTVSPTT